MGALVVYESMFGNTRRIAKAVAAGIAPYTPVTVVEVGHAAPTLDAVDLLVVGGPTHAFGMSREGTRNDASVRAARTVISRDAGIRDWLLTLRASVPPWTPAATFDTKTAHPKLPGSAAGAARRSLKRRGFRPLAAPMTFYVAGVRGPLLAGEEDRARRWGRQLGLAIQQRTEAP